MADTSLNENRIGLLIWQTSNVFQSKIRKQLINFHLSFNEYLILETVYKLSKSIADISQVDVNSEEEEKDDIGNDDDWQ